MMHLKYERNKCPNKIYKETEVPSMVGDEPPPDEHVEHKNSECDFSDSLHGPHVDAFILEVEALILSDSTDWHKTTLQALLLIPKLPSKF